MLAASLSALGPQADSPPVKPTSLFSGHASRPASAPVLVQDRGNDPSARVAFELEVRVGKRDKEFVFGTCEESEGGCPVICASR
jgi:hypothetical protein